MKKKKQKKKEASEEEVQLFKELCDAIERMGIEIRIEAGNFRGGFCMLDDNKRVLFVNKKHSIDKRIALIISELKKLDSQETALTKELKEKINSEF
ncbi:MAG: hypothetical protein GWN00_02080 [Aliifodinibius sp.]|nr:hypothetical protein [Fodinibius sp.]NIY23645.1 hypothetical protein [Fodinibius sp.]